MTARIDLADLERYAATYRSMREAGERGTDAVREALPALIAAVRAAANVGPAFFKWDNGDDQRDLLRLAQIVGDLNTALDAFDFKEETNGS